MYEHVFSNPFPLDLRIVSVSKGSVKATGNCTLLEVNGRTDYELNGTRLSARRTWDGMHTVCALNRADTYTHLIIYATSVPCCRDHQRLASPQQRQLPHQVQSEQYTNSECLLHSKVDSTVEIMYQGDSTTSVSHAGIWVVPLPSGGCIKGKLLSPSDAVCC